MFVKVGNENGLGTGFLDYYWHFCYRNFNWGVNFEVMDAERRPHFARAKKFFEGIDKPRKM
jgi:hypothetical protein